MTVYVDPLIHRGWKLRGHLVKSSHMFTDHVELDELHAMAERIGMKRVWFQEHDRLPHYDVTSSRRAAAVAAGALEVDSRESCRILRERMERVGCVCPWCQGRGWHHGECHPKEQCGGCDGNGRVSYERFVAEKAERDRVRGSAVR